MSILDRSENFHPYECSGYGRCPHCDRQKTEWHDPATCALCDPEYDNQPNPYWQASAVSGEAESPHGEKVA